MTGVTLTCPYQAERQLPGPMPTTIPGIGGDMGLKVVVHIRLLVALQLAHMGSVLLAWVVQLAALTEHLEVHRQWGRLHVHHLVVGDGCLWGAHVVGSGGCMGSGPASLQQEHGGTWHPPT